ncbi:cation:proton antiporter [Helicovermis profundi]|uniref:Cation:proton antiporter n=2 Tax=Helicovermis profundi TaxID=3065157 RepID=A0AAU9EFC6_9FIRM|nr:cation:proton antiporter [Clostridia bacterium S502]
MMNTLVFLLIGIGILFTFLRLVIGPSTFDRVLSLDIINIIITGALVFIGFIFNNELYLDIAIVYAILSFIETVVFARYLEGRI